MEKRTPKGWTEYLAQEEAEFTLSEYMAGCLSRILGCAIEQAQAAGHTEAMVGRFEQWAARRDQLFGLSDAQAELALTREALARERTAVDRANGLGAGGEHAV